MKRFGAEASAADSPGSAMAGSPIDGCPLPASCIPTPACALLPGPKAGARCGSSARRDLSGGPPARAVPTGLSGEGPVTGLERRGRVVLVRLVVNQGSWEEPGERIEVAGQAVCDRQVGGRGGVSEGQGQPGRGGCRRVHDRAVRAEPEEQPVQAVEPALVGQLLPTAGEGRGDTQERGRVKDSRRADGARIARSLPIRGKVRSSWSSPIRSTR